MKEIHATWRKGYALLSRSGKKFLAVYTIILSCISFLDLLALVLLSKVVLSQLDVVSGTNPPEINVKQLITVFGLFILRTFLSTFVYWKATIVFSSEETQIGQQNLTRRASSLWSERSQLPLTDLANTIDQGPSDLVRGVLVLISTLGSELFTATSLIVLVLVLQPQIALISFGYFMVVSIFQFRFLARKSSQVGKVFVLQHNEVYRLLNDLFRLEKLLTVMHSKSLHSHIGTRREILARSRASMDFLNALPRYSMELVLVTGMFVVGASALIISGRDNAILALVIFGAAGIRLLPIMNRIQGILVQLNSTLPQARRTFINENLQPAITCVNNTSDHTIAARLIDVSYRFPNTELNALSKINLDFKYGKSYAIVGPSGGGKTTLIDILLGLIEPSEGMVQHDRLLNASYVPQESYVFAGTIGQNISLEWDAENIDQNQVLRVSNEAQIGELPLQNNDDFDKLTIDNSKISGGQKQRIGIARALYRNPNMLILDEATSALDNITESLVSTVIESRSKNMVLITIAHRLSTIRNYDFVIYIDSGTVIGMGSFDELRRALPKFAEQINLGLI
jgi:ABC-type multidrug transport system fused ATPase/permease subunit